MIRRTVPSAARRGRVRHALVRLEAEVDHVQLIAALNLKRHPAVRADSKPAALRPLLGDGPERDTARTPLAALRAHLGEPGTAERVAEIAVRLCREGSRFAPRRALPA